MNRKLSSKEIAHIRVTLNGHGGFESQVIAADALEGWVEVMDSWGQNPRGKKIIVQHNVISRRLYGDVRITYRGVSLLRAAANGKVE